MSTQFYQAIASGSVALLAVVAATQCIEYGNRFDVLGARGWALVTVALAAFAFWLAT